MSKLKEAVVQAREAGKAIDIELDGEKLRVFPKGLIRSLDPSLRPVGRPPGSKNKPKVAPAAQAPATVAAAAQAKPASFWDE